MGFPWIESRASRILLRMSTASKPISSLLRRRSAVNGVTVPHVLERHPVEAREALLEGGAELCIDLRAHSHVAPIEGGGLMDGFEASSLIDGAADGRELRPSLRPAVTAQRFPDVETDAQANLLPEHRCGAQV